MRKDSIYLQRWYAEEYDKDRFDGSFGSYLHDQEIKTFLFMIDGLSGRILDVGAGTGKLSLPLLFQSKQVTSVDFSLEMLRIAGKKAEEKGMNLKSAISDALHLCFRDNSFECVISSRMLMHLPDWRKGISELCRVTKGIVVLDFPPLISFAGIDSFLKKFKSLFVKDMRTYRTFFMQSIIRELKNHNFHIAELKKQFFLPIAFHRWLNRPRLSLSIEKLCRMMGLVWFMGAPITVKAIKKGYQDGSRARR